MSFVDERPQEMLDWLADRKLALETLDMAYARRNFPKASSDEVLLLAMHKARYECTDIAPNLRRASAKWIKARGFKRLYDLPWPKKGLPK